MSLIGLPCADGREGRRKRQTLAKLSTIIIRSTSHHMLDATHRRHLQHADTYSDKGNTSQAAQHLHRRPLCLVLCLISRTETEQEVWTIPTACRGSSDSERHLPLHLCALIPPQLLLRKEPTQGPTTKHPATALADLAARILRTKT